MKPVTELATTKAQPDPKLREPCDDPVVLPNAAMGSGQVQREWARDRKALIDCKAKHLGLDGFYQKRDKGLAGD